MMSLPIKRCKTLIQIDTYIFYFNCEIIMRKILAVGWVRGKRFQVDVYIEILHVIHITLKYCIGYSESKSTFKHKSNTLRTGSLSHS